MSRIGVLGSLYNNHRECSNDKLISRVRLTAIGEEASRVGVATRMRQRRSTLVVSVTVE